MKKILLLLLLATFSIQAQTLQNPTYGNVKLKNNTTDNSATKVNVQSTDGTVNTISKSDLVNVVEVNDVPSLPLIGEAGKIYVVKNLNKIYRWNGTFYQELADINNVKLTGNQTIDGYKTFTSTITATTSNNDDFAVNAFSDAGSGVKAASNTSTALRAESVSAPAALFKTTSGSRIVSFQYGFDDKAYIDINGGYVKSSVPENNILLAGGGDVAQSDLPIGSITQAALDSKINISEKGAINGVATLGSDVKVPNSQIPALAISETFPVSSQAQMLALSQADQGDVAIRSDISKSFILRQSPASILGNWNELLTPTSAVTSVNGQAGVVTLAKSDVGLSNVDNTSDANKPVSTAQQTALNLKENAFSKNTAFNKNFGITSGTVVEGGTLGSNAYSSTAHLPLTGGTLTGALNGTSATFSSTVTTGDNILVPAGKYLGFSANSYMTPEDNIQGARIKTLGGFIVESSGTTFTSTVTATSFNGSATLTGTPTAPTAAAGTNTTQIATTAFVTSADSGNVKLTGNQTISGQKSFSLTGKIDMQTNNAFPAISVTALGSNGQSAAQFINSSSFPNSTALSLQTGSSGGLGNMALNVSNQSSIGTGIFSDASNGGVSISSQSGNGDSYISNITFGGTGRNYVGRNNGTETYSVDKTGKVTATSYTATSLPVFENNAAASSLAVGQFYRTSTGVLMVKF